MMMLLWNMITKQNTKVVEKEKDKYDMITKQLNKITNQIKIKKETSFFLFGLFIYLFIYYFYKFIL